MKILFVIGQFNPVRGGAEIQAERLAFALKNKGLDVEVLTSRLRGTSFFDVINGVNVRRVSGIGFGRIKMFTFAINLFFLILFKFKHFDRTHPLN